MNQFLHDDATRLRFIEAVRKREYLYDRNSLAYKDLDLKQRAWEAITVECNIPSVKEARNAWKKMRDNFRDSVRRTLALQNGSTQNLTPYRYHQFMAFLEPFVTSKNFDHKAVESPQEHEPLVLLSHIENNDNGAIIVDPLEFDSSTMSPEEVFVNGDPLLSNTSESNNNKRVDSPPTRKPVKRKRVSSDVEIYEPVNSDRQSPVSEEEKPVKGSAYSSTNHLDIFFKSMCETTKAMPEKWQLEVKKRIFEVVTCAEEDMLKEHEASSRRKSNK